MKMKRVLPKILFISLPSIFVFLLILELCLRVGGWVYLWQRHPEAYKEAKVSGSGQNKFTILCLGDSFTFGSGTSSENSYPRQLGRLLRENINKDINVINAGRLGNTSSLLLNNFKKDIARYNPGIVIVMVGCNNFWNLQDSSYFILYKDKAGYFEKMDNALSHLRVYKLIKIGYLNYKNSKKNNLNIIHAKISEESLKLSSLGTELFLKGRHDLAKETLQRAAALDKNNYEPHLWLAHIYNARSEFKEGQEELCKAIETIDEWDNNLVYNVICRIPIQKDSRAAKIELNKIKQYIKTKYSGDNEKRKSLVKIIDARLDFLEDERILQRVLEYDLEEIIRLAKSRGVTLILQTYPHDGLPLSDVFQKISTKFNIPLVDNFKAFKEIEKYGNIGDFFVPDKHCNDKGYRIIAENTYNTLVEHRLLPGDKEGQPEPRTGQKKQ